ncbi:MAG: ABC transporter permease [Aquihabitans sp.]
MILALREIRRALVRFGLLVCAIALLVFLILFQQALRDGLITGFVGALRNQSAPVLVYSVDAQRTLQGSVIQPSLERQITGADGVGASAQIGAGTFTIEVAGDEKDASLLGTEDLALFQPADLSSGRRPTGPLEAVGSAADFSVGDSVKVVPAQGGQAVTIKVVGLARDVQLSVTPTLFTDLASFQMATNAANPEATKLLPNAIALRPKPGVTAAELVATINAATPDAEALTRADAADKSPGVAQVTQSFQVIFLLYGLVVPLVTGLFFLILTLQKSGSLTLLRAIGARSSTLARSLLLQVVIVIGLGLALGIALYYPLSQAQVGGLTLRFDVTTVVIWAVLLMVLALISSLASLRRVLRIDPLEATTGGGFR